MSAGPCACLIALNSVLTLSGIREVPPCQGSRKHRNNSRCVFNVFLRSSDILGTLLAFIRDGAALHLRSHDDYIPKSLRFLSKGGRFMEIGKRLIWSHDQMHRERPDVPYLSSPEQC